jgi:hypothetical protein
MVVHACALSSIAIAVTMCSMSSHPMLQVFLVVSLLAIVRDGLAWLMHCNVLVSPVSLGFDCWPL